MIDIRTESATVPSAAGDLRALVHIPALDGPLPGLVLVDGSGDGACDDWGEWPERFARCGAIVLTHDKPGCGGSPGDWTQQSFADRASESVAALHVLHEHPAVTGNPTGLLGISQGGWVSLLAAATAPTHVDFVVSVSGPGVTPHVQDRVRIERDLRAAGLSEPEVVEALAWIDERADRLRGGEPPADVLASQQAYADRPWYALATYSFETVETLAFLAGILDFDPRLVIPDVRCPVLAVFGGADAIVPVPESVAAFAECLPPLPGDPHGLAVFPNANHGLFVADPDPDVPRTDQLAPGFLAMVGGFLRDRMVSGAVPRLRCADTVQV